MASPSTSVALTTQASVRSFPSWSRAGRLYCACRNIAITILRLEGETNIAKATRGARNYPRRAFKLAGLNIS